MATSLLAGIDWNNLSSAELTTAVKVLCQALQERFNIAKVRLNGAFSTLQGPSFPSDNTLSNTFPYKTNNPRWTLSSGDPLANFTDQNLIEENDLNYLLERASSGFADIDRWNDAATNLESGETIFNLGQTDTDDPQYPTRLHEVTGYTTYPDLSVMAPEEVKKFYDMVTALRYVIRQTNTATSPTSYLVWNGEFDVDQDITFGIEDPSGKGADYSNGGSSGQVPNANTAPYTGLKNLNSNLFATTTKTFDESTDSGTFPPPWSDTNQGGSFNVIVRRFINSNYTAYIKCAQRTHKIDYGVLKTAIGATGFPLDWKTQMNQREVHEIFPTGLNTNFQFPGPTTAENQRYWETLTTSNVGDIATIYRDNLLQPITLPASHTSVPANQKIEVRAQEKTPSFNGNLRLYILEDWDGDGGFEYYTP